MIDGHVGIAWVPSTAPCCLTDGSVPPGFGSFDWAAAAYSQASLARASDKEQRGVTHAVAAGVEIDGVLGIISAPRLRTLALAQLTFDVLLTGCATRGLLLTLIGCWIYVLMYRRPLLALLHAVFHEGAPFAPDNPEISNSQK